MVCDRLNEEVRAVDVKKTGIALSFLYCHRSFSGLGERVIRIFNCSAKENARNDMCGVSQSPVRSTV